MQADYNVQCRFAESVVKSALISAPYYLVLFFDPNPELGWRNPYEEAISYTL